MSQWEYKVESVPLINKTTEQLAELLQIKFDRDGEGEFELVSTMLIGQDIIYTMKRLASRPRR